CRINAESPETFAPSPGRIQFLHFPGGPGIRVDSAAHADYVISPHYDSLIAKLIAHGSDRTEAIRRMTRALDTTIIEGVPTSIPLHQKIMRDRDFQDGDLSTGFLERLKSKTVVAIGSVKAS
ncbi:MAG: acetyl-CoA carboxylase biotin carboxylase subunit, partial [Acidobacteria bacterium]|nr:acetyl-CoA carboxylase biotin carboxylase subunit [Acidobacteriota bacterium]